MNETMSHFLQGMISIFNDEKTAFEEKIELFVANYIQMVTEEPDILLFILGEMRNRPEDISKKIPANQVLTNSAFIRQYREKAVKGDIKDANPLQFMMNLTGLTAFPFLVKPFLSAIGVLDETRFNQLIQERKKLIPVWIKAIMEA